MEKFIERGTSYQLRNGSLILYETNCACKNIKFHFDEYVLTLMLSGHKTIVREERKLEFFPGTFFIPEVNTINDVSIPDASFHNPTKCLVLKIKPSFIKNVYENLIHSGLDGLETMLDSESKTNDYFLSNDRLLIEAFKKLYTYQSKDTSDCKSLVEDLILKEILLRLLYTDAAKLLKRNFEKDVENDNISKVVNHIKSNLHTKMNTNSLAKIARLGQTNFFKKFKQSTGLTPVEYIMHERINFAKILIKKNELTLQEIAFKSGFNSYEYFCSLFKKIEKVRPTAYKKGCLEKSMQYHN